jgi:acetyl esterase
MRWFYEHYLPGGVAANDPYASPLCAPSVAGVAPATVITVEYDPLRDDGRRYAARLRQAGVEVAELRYDDLAHGTLALLGRFSAAERMLTDLAHALSPLP